MRAFIFVAVATELVLGFENCSGFSPSQQVTGGGPIAGLCLVSAASRDALEGYDVKSVCTDQSHYVCETRGPGAAGVDERCADIAGLGHVCMIVDAQSVGDAAVAHCANIDVRADGGFLIQADAESWDQAFLAAVNKCRMRTL